LLEQLVEFGGVKDLRDVLRLSFMKHLRRRSERISTLGTVEAIGLYHLYHIRVGAHPEQRL